VTTTTGQGTSGLPSAGSRAPAARRRRDAGWEAPGGALSITDDVDDGIDADDALQSRKA
jgi:hypothetical protein